MNGDTGDTQDGQFRQLYNTVFPILFRVSLRIVGSADAAEDLCQEAFSRLYEKRMVFPNADEAKYWLIRVVKNAALNYAKRKGRERRVLEKAFHETRQTEEAGDAALLRRETRQEVGDALAKLPENLRAPLVLKEYGDLNYQEIGRILGITEGNVKVRIFRAREKLAALLKAEVGYVS